MMTKRYKLIDDIEFSIDAKQSIYYIDYGAYDPYYPHSRYLHIRLRFHNIPKVREFRNYPVSVYVPRSKMVSNEEKNMKRQKEDYEPSEEFLHLLRATLLLVMRGKSGKKMLLIKGNNIE